MKNMKTKSGPSVALVFLKTLIFFGLSMMILSVARAAEVQPPADSGPKTDHQQYRRLYLPTMSVDTLALVGGCPSRRNHFPLFDSQF